MNKEEKHNRRKFLSLGLLTGAAMITQQAKAETTESKKNQETMMLLTPDGKLVEVQKSIVQTAKSGSKATNQEILKWTNVPDKKS